MQLGVTVKDKITGFTGVVIGFVRYLSGCNQVLIVPKTKSDGVLVSAEWLDVQRCEVLNKKPVVLDNGDTPGFAKLPPKR